MTQENERTCVCGHREEEHGEIMTENGKIANMGCTACDCVKFEEDNEHEHGA